jgi:hypothetical protein
MKQLQLIEKLSSDLSAAESMKNVQQMCLDSLIRGDFQWTKRCTFGKNAFFQIGIARATGPLGGILLIRERHPSNIGATQEADFYETWMKRNERTLSFGLDLEARAFRECYHLARQLYYRLTATTPTSSTVSAAASKTF